MQRTIATCLAAGMIAALLPGCASVPPPKGELEKADLAYRNAEQAQGSSLAPLETRIARDKLEAARAAMRDKRNLEARRLAEQAKVDAVLAETKARSAMRVRAASEIQADIDAIRVEAERSGRIVEESR